MNRRQVWMIEIQRNNSIIWESTLSIHFTKEAAKRIARGLAPYYASKRIVKYVPQEKAK